MTNEGHYLLQPRSPCGLSLCNCCQCNTFLYNFPQMTTHYFSHYQYMLRKVANQGKLQNSSFCRVEQQVLCHRTNINHLSSLHCCTLSLNTVLFGMWHYYIHWTWDKKISVFRTHGAWSQFFSNKNNQRFCFSEVVGFEVRIPNM